MTDGPPSPRPKVGWSCETCDDEGTVEATAREAFRRAEEHIEKVHHGTGAARIASLEPLVAVANEASRRAAMRASDAEGGWP